MPTAEENIYNRLVSAPTFHPVSASLFANDWTLEPGDVVSVVSGEETYSVPVYSMNLEWKGNSKVDIQSTGNKKRDRIADLNRRTYGSGGRAYQEQSEYYHQITETDESLDVLYVKTGVNNLGQDETLYGNINVQAGRITQIVSAVGADGEVTAASIVLAINNQTGQSVADIAADKVSITGSTTINDCLVIENGSLKVKKTAVFTGDVTLIGSDGCVTAKQFYVGTSGKIRLGGPDPGYYDITYSGYAALYKDLKVVDNGDNTYKLQKKSVGDNDWTDVPNSTFSRATSLSGAWSGGNYVVTASPQGNTLSYDPPMRLNGSAQYSNFSAEIIETTGGSTVARKSIYGYLIYTQSGSSSYVDVNTKSDGTGTTVARISVTGGSTTLSGGWDNGYYVVTASPQGETYSITLAPNLYPNGTSDIFRSASLPSGATNLGSLASVINGAVGSRSYVCFYAGVSANGSTSGRKLYALAIN